MVNGYKVVLLPSLCFPEPESSCSEAVSSDSDEATDEAGIPQDVSLSL